jgi:hypothetical protein
MLNDDSGTVRAVAWSEMCPWLRLFRCFRVAIRFRLLLLSAAAVLLTVSGWAFLTILFSGNPEVGKSIDEAYSDSPWLAFPDLVRSGSTDLVANRPQLPNLDAGFLREKLGVDFSSDKADSVFHRSTDPFWGSFTQLSRPLRHIFSSEVTVGELAFLLLCGVWALAVWAFFGGAITRFAAVELAREERLGWGAMIRHARFKWGSYLFAPLSLLVVVLFCAAGMALVGIFLRWDAGLFIIGLFLWPLMLVGGLVMTFLLVWLALGWPLMWATIGSEGEDGFDALSRSQQYLFQRPLHYLFYALVAVLLGWLGWLVVSNFAAAIIAATHWAADWGADTLRWSADDPEAGSRRIELLLSGDAEIGLVGVCGAGLILFWGGCVKMLAVGFLYSYFWTASTCIYLLLRRDADATEMDEVFLEEQEEEASYGLPPIDTDEVGAPVVDEPAPPSDSAEPPSGGGESAPPDDPPSEP